MLRNTHRTELSIAFITMLLGSGSAVAEVSDKEPTTTLFWAVSLAAAFLCLVCARIRPWLGLLAFAPAALWFASLFAELHSLNVGPYLKVEQGASYYWHAYAASGAVLSGLVLGFVWHRRGPGKLDAGT